MQRYLEIKLQKIESAEWTALYHDGAVPHTEPERLDYAIECAEAGDVRALRDELARRIGDTRIIRFVNLPKLRKGERWTKPMDSWIGKAAAAVPVIRTLLREYKSKQWKKSDGWSAEQFAVEIYDVHVDQIARHLKHGRRR
jgi:hypothetical protein